LLGVLGVLELVLGLMLLMLLCACGEAGVFLGEGADNVGGDFAMDYSLAVVTYDFESEFLGWEVSKGLMS
jgi:hypothetical protein